MSSNVSSTTIAGLIQSISGSFPGGFEIPRQANSNWREELIVVYCIGEGTFSVPPDFTPARQIINLQMDMYDLNGKWLGFQLGVHESMSTPADLMSTPPSPLSMDGPPVPQPPIKEWTKGVWTFADGSEIYAVGTAWSHLVPYKDGSFNFMVATGQIITKGSGRYEGAHGSKQATGTTMVPAGALQSGRFPAPGAKFIAKTIEVFRIVKKQDINPNAPGGPPPGAGAGGGAASSSGSTGQQQGSSSGMHQQPTHSGSAGSEEEESRGESTKPYKERRQERRHE
jgi:hypothetical protein